jgi:UDP-N-acetylmuramate: L-alanyl-gamma-D-glutamyl-meso-diaminopimelate ligase
MDKADLPIVYFNPHAIALKKLPLLSEDIVFNAFANPKLQVFQNAQTLFDFLKSLDWQNKNLLMMSSGNFDGMKFEHFFNS